MHIPLLPTLFVLLLHSLNPTLAASGEPKYPAGVDPKTNPYERTQDGVPGKPTWECTYKKKVLWNRYVLEARNWNMTEEVLKEACSKSDMMTVWNFDPEWHDVDGAQRIAVAVSFFLDWEFLSSFSSPFSMTLLRANAYPFSPFFLCRRKNTTG